MACYPGPGPFYGPYGGPFGPCGVCVGPCVCGPAPCGPCPPLYSGVGKCFPGPASAPCSAWEIDLLPTTLSVSSTGFQPIYTSGLRAATAITSIVDGAAPVVTYNLQNVKGSVCNVSASLTVTKIVGSALVNTPAVASATVQPYAQSVTLTFNTLPGGGAVSPGPLLGSQSTLSTKFA